MWFGQSVNDGTIPSSSNAVLLADIDLGGSEWTPVASTQESGYAYTGTFDGNEFAVSNFTVNYTVTAESIDTGAGFFARIGSGGTVRGLTVKDATIKSTGITKNEEGVTSGLATDVAGGIAGTVFGGRIENCAVEDSSITSESRAGGIAGQSADNAVISGCTVSGSVAIKATGRHENYGGIMGIDGVAGIVGSAAGGEITDCLYLADEGGSVTSAAGDVYGIAKLDTNTPSTMTNNAFYDPKIEAGSNVNDSEVKKLIEDDINNGMTVTGVTLTPDAPVSISAGESMEFTLDTLPTAGKIAQAIANGVVKVSTDEGDSGVVTIDESALATDGKLTITGAKAGTETATITVTVYKVDYSTMQPDTSSPTEYTFELAAEVGGTTPPQPGGSGSTGGGGGGGCSAGFGALALLAAVPLLFRRKK